MTPYRAVAVMSTALIMLLGGCAVGSGRTGTVEDIVIGADLELSGSSAPVGTAYERALQLKVDQVNASGVLGAGRRLTLVVKDNRAEPSLSTTNVGELAALPRLAAMVTGVCSDCLLATVAIINDRRIPTISLAPASAVSTPVEQRRYIFKLAPNPAHSASTLSVELARSGVHKIGVLTTNDTYGNDGAAEMARDAQKVGLTVVARAQFRPSDTDLTRPAETVVAKGPEALVIWALPEQAAEAARSARGAGFAGKVYFDSAAAGNLFLTGPTAAATDGASLVFTQTLAIDDVVATTPAKSTRQQWFHDYLARYGDYYGYASFAADAVQVIVNAVVKSGGVEPDKIRAILEDTQIDGLSGPIRLSPDNHSGLMPQALTMLVARSGRWRLVG